MADSPPPDQVSSLPDLVIEESTTTSSSPARGAEMRNFLQTRLQKNRAPPLVHSWDFYHDRQDRSPPQQPPSPSPASTTSNGNGPSAPEDYSQRLEHLAIIDDVRKFWNVYNNFDVARLALRDSVHLFHKGVKPVWEDPRNARGGAWTFRVPKTLAREFWQEIGMMAIGEQLQTAVEDGERQVFRDDICGVSLGVRFNSVLVQVWNRDGEHTAGVERVLRTVLEGLSEELRPRDGSYYYKRHCEHAGFTASAEEAAAAGERSRPGTSTGASIDGELQGEA